MENILHAGPPGPVQALVIVAHHAQVPMRLGQPEQDLFLHMGRVPVLVAHQVADAHRDSPCNAVILHQLIGPDLEVGKVNQVPLPQHTQIAGAATAQRRQELTPPCMRSRGSMSSSAMRSKCLRALLTTTCCHCQPSRRRSGRLGLKISSKRSSMK